MNNYGIRYTYEQKGISFPRIEKAIKYIKAKSIMQAIVYFQDRYVHEEIESVTKMM